MLFRCVRAAACRPRLMCAHGANQGKFKGDCGPTRDVNQPTNGRPDVWLPGGLVAIALPGAPSAGLDAAAFHAAMTHLLTQLAQPRGQEPA
ncbi:hypothetical protein SAMN02745857_04273 [Andreprevotia lacus DSM 23236]|uniref:Uncharacterized protein n=1 Tax=Andreprevotia lacus DSM 23236 TaxID=1121001 RepID=A0A1W1Y143_9NEIS|nr:hypothetical protein SAMN02745857_04273 [Andreprevotia lacus DSM 23236]